MINCKKCKFLVKEEMKHALMSNRCPACGSKLFSDSDMNQISFLQNKISSQKFGKRLDDFQIYDITIFMISEMKKMKKTIVADMKERYHNREGQSADQPEGVDAESSSLVEESGITWEDDEEVVVSEEAPLSEDEKRKIKSDIARQYESIDSEVDDPAFEDDEDDRVSRLKNIAKNRNKNKTGPVVSRVT